MNKHYDVIIIGAGPGGYETALYASSSGLKVALIEENKLGGTCLNCGCIPTKTYYSASKYIHEINKMNSFGFETNYKFDFSKIKEKKDNVVLELHKGIEFLLKNANVDLYYGKGIITSTNTVKINSISEDIQSSSDDIQSSSDDIQSSDILIQSDNIIIATGSSPVKDILPNGNLTISSTELLNLDKLPDSLTIIGGGVIGIEMATIFNSLGTKVEVMEMMDNILPNLDSDVSKRIQLSLSKLGIKFHVKSIVNQIIDKNSIEIKEKDNLKIITSDYILLSVGRKACTDVFENIEIKTNKKGFIVNEYFETSIPNIYAIGDCNGINMLAHFATYSGYKVIDKILKKDNKINLSLCPSAIFTFPEVAMLGLTEKMAKEANIEYEVKKVSFRQNGKALSMDEKDGFIKALLSEDEIIGICICGPNASDLIHEVNILMNNHIKLHEFKDYVYAHPTLSEILKLI